MNPDVFDATGGTKGSKPWNTGKITGMSGGIFGTVGGASSSSSSSSRTTSDHQNVSTAAVPSISLPKGGGAIRGIGEKFSTNLATGTGSLTVPIYTSPGRSGFGPAAFTIL